MPELANIAYTAAVAGLAGMALAAVIYFTVRRQPDGSQMMRDVAELIHSGAMTFLRREYTFLFPFLAIVAFLLYLAIGRGTALAYIGGGVCSILAGLFGMEAATRANVRTTEAARTHGQGMALRTAFNGGAVINLSPSVPDNKAEITLVELGTDDSHSGAAPSNWYTQFLHISLTH